MRRGKTAENPKAKSGKAACGCGAHAVPASAGKSRPGRSVFLTGIRDSTSMDKKRFAVVGVVLGILVTAAFFIGSPMFGNFDQLR